MTVGTDDNELYAWMHMDDDVDMQAALREEIKASHIVGYCRECSGKILQAEIDNGLANEYECAQCVRDEVLGMV